MTWSGSVDVPQQAEQHVEHDDRPGVADMGEVVDGRTANVEPDRARIDRREILFAAGQGVVKTKRRAPSGGFPAAREAFGLRAGLVGVIGNS